MAKQGKFTEVVDSAPPAFLRRIAGSMLIASEAIDAGVMSDGVQITEIRVKLPTEHKPEYTVICKGRFEGKPVVAFHNSDTYHEAVVGASSRLVNATMKWREDRPYEG
jgi:hypothetical protein